MDGLTLPLAAIFDVEVRGSRIDVSEYVCIILMIRIGYTKEAKFDILL
jgi:hypothetical protein